ncbi:flagellar export chaperone FliS [Caloranaerobacter ferrireducens]|uniref:flagellar export chaperone FliS n=1 Tax=Caloranaerobacter ferrireducens TaxID=1323370 RepID=UPI00084DE47A|nr:flagellar export chaperone FliS [Caloranaerobacter ferrireducens]
MAMKNPYAQYQQNSIMTASPEELTLMLYNGALKFLKQAILYIEEKNIESAHERILRVQDILVEFMSTVDRKYEIGDNLYKLYEFMNYRLREANFKKDIEVLEEVYVMIKELRDTWQQAMKIAKKGK